MKAYASHNNWSKLSIIKDIEVNERVNSWFDDSELDLERSLAKWGCKTPELALYYIFRSDFKDLNPLEDQCPNDDEESLREWEEFRLAWQNPLSLVEAFDISNCIEAHYDQDGGILYIRPVFK